MGDTMVEKLLKKNTGKEDVQPGDFLTVNVDRVMIHDLFAPFVIKKFKQMGFEDVWDNKGVVFVYDHLVPTSSTEDLNHHKKANEFAKAQELEYVHRSDGVCHQLMVEQKYATPGEVVFGTDSHTTTYGAVGAFATGIGYTEMAKVLGTGNLWVKVPPTLSFKIEGELPAGVYAKDVILRIIADIGTDGATYKAMEFSGSTIEGMSVSARMTISNMAVEAGAKLGIIEPDKKTYKIDGVAKEEVEYLTSDKDANFAETFEYNVDNFEPVVACPSNVDKVKRIKELGEIEIDQAFLGSCTNGRLEDLEIAANILEGKKVSKYTRLIVTPASRKVYKKAVEAGIIDILVNAGAIVNTPACGLCCGRSGGILADGEKVIASNNRNFLGRMGSSNSEIFLASPATVAASVIEGKIADPRQHV